ncbi:hypothetical protein [Ghiorsea bivora]|uniref:hypothetical protein n=1 Tax=Ghiorsea bivora TaxID=1485545 RepID=UPI00056FF5A7|nr:hypothetical protein [Ghiorsea bivora]
MTSCKKFIVFTRGRTGSTAIVDEIDSHTKALCLQEPFIPLEGIKELMKALESGESYESVSKTRKFVPFELWLKQWRIFCFLRKRFYWRRLRLVGEKGILRSYLRDLELNAINKGMERKVAFGFKLLVNHLDNWPKLSEVLYEGGYVVVYLERKNVVRKVLSGIVASKRGVYNRKNFQHVSENFEIDLDDFEMRVRSELVLVEKEKDMLRKVGFDLLSVSYEDFLQNRNTFLRELFEFIGVDFELPKESEYSIMIKDMKSTVSNYEALLERVETMGLKHLLES